MKTIENGLMNKSNTILICKTIKYYSRKDEDAFFEWIKKINCIDGAISVGDELHIHIANDNLHDHDLRDLLALFYRYNLNMKQLERFLNESNKQWFHDNKKAYWYKSVFES